MPVGKPSLTRNTEGVKHVWELMVTDFYWSREALAKLRVGLRSTTGATSPAKVKLQPFEVIVAAVFAQLRPDYDWWVTPNRADRGVDFMGRGVFLSSRELGIDAAITIGGQCKKRGPRKDIVNELSGSFVKMERTHHPTFFVAAFAAPLTSKRIIQAKEDLERAFHRHCHILDRPQLESLISANLIAVKPIIRQAFDRKDADYVLNYFEQQAGPKAALDLQLFAPSSVLAGESFRVRLQISSSCISENSFRLRWNPSSHQQSAMLLAPLGADSKEGIGFSFQIAASEDPFIVEHDLEFLLYAIGNQPLGTISIQPDGTPGEPMTITDLPAVDVVENLRPPFYDVPYQAALDELERGLVRARAGRVSSVAIVGAGGAGKTRLCEEMCLESRRHGASVVSASQAHSTEFPRRILANLLLGLTDAGLPNDTITNRIADILSRLEPGLANRARPAIETLCGQAGKLGSFDDDQALLSVLVLLIAQRSRSHPVIVHLHDLHWCTLDVLETIDRLIWQLDHLKVHVASDAPTSGIRVLFLLEGRMHEYREDSETGFSTQVFERFIERLACPVARCRSFERHESAAFARRLFEQGHSANRMLPRALLELQEELIDTVDRVAGGNPLHMLEQVKLLQQHGILAQNPRTGFMYMNKPDFRHVSLPPTVFETIEARWRYYWVNDRSLAVLLWAVALVDDNLPGPLFRHLWSRLASEVTQTKIESTEFLHFPQSDEEGLQVSFRHENYFQTVRRIQLPEAQRRTVVDTYSSWFSVAKGLSPVLRYLQAKVELEAPNPDLRNIAKILRAAQATALKRKDRSLTSRILVTLLDGVTWPSNQRKLLTLGSLIHACDDEVALCKNLSRAGQTDVAYERIQHTLDAIEARLRSHSVRTCNAVDPIMRRRLILLTMKARLLYRDRRPAEAVAITDDAVKELNAFVAAMTTGERHNWNDVIMEVYHAHSVTVALAGDIRRALVEGRKAADIAETLLTTSPHALDVIITYANILLSEAPEKTELLLQRYLLFSEPNRIREDTRLRLDLNISMARIIMGYREARAKERNGRSRLAMAHETLLGVFKHAHPLGRLGEAAAAALLLGLISALRDTTDEIDWFSQAISLAIRGRQLEILWRAHINLAHSLYRSGKSAHDAAAAALDILMYSLSSYAEPDRNPRFDLLSVPMAHAVRYLILDHDDKAEKILGKFPALRRMFANVESGEMKADRDGRISHEWLRVGEVDYVIY